jgi:hypothetical protein
MTTIQDADLSQHSDRLPGAVVFITGRIRNIYCSLVAIIHHEFRILNRWWLRDWQEQLSEVRQSWVCISISDHSVIYKTHTTLSAKVVVADLNLAGAEETVTEIQKAGGCANAGSYSSNAC